MEHIYFLPEWFITYGIGLELVFAIITLLVAIYAFKTYKLGLQKQTKLFGLGFLSISLSYIIWFILNLFALIELSEGTFALDLNGATRLINLGAYAHIIFFLLGLILLVYTNLKIKSPGTFSLLFSIIFVSIILTNSKALLFYAISSILIFYLAIHYLFEYKEKRNSHLELMFFSFVFLFLGTLELIFTTAYSTHYAIAHIFILISYVLILINLVSVFKNGQKKK